MKNYKKTKISIIIILLLLLVGGFTLYKYMNSQPKEIIAASFLPDEKDAQKMTKKERLKAAEKEIDETTFTLSIYPEATFENGSSKGSLYIRNEVKNAYPIAVELIENGSGDVIYESGAIQPGYEITEGKLAKKLTKGKYKCTANVSIFDPKTKKYKGQTAAEVTLEVKS